MKFTYRCTDCGTEYSPVEIIYLCPGCQEKQEPGTFQKGVLKTILDPDYLKSLASRESVSPKDFSPYPIPYLQSYPVGNTPLIAPRKLRTKSGCPGLFLKNDGLNPSGSLKDRASQLVAAQAMHFSENMVALASTGNAGSAMACAGASYGLNIVLFVPETAPKAKLMQSVLYGATVVPIQGTYDEAFALSIEFTKRKGGINRNTAFNPLTIEGKKTVSIEIFNQLGRTVPDVVYVPTGDGVILAGVYKGFFDLKEAGITEKLPRIVCVQAEKSNAVADAYRTGTMKALEKAETRADSISVASPANGRMAVEYIKSSGGWVTEVADQEITLAQLTLSRDAGVLAEPAAAAAYAGFVRDWDKFRGDEIIIVLLTGTGFKDMDSVKDHVAIPPSIPPGVDEIGNLTGTSLH